MVITRSAVLLSAVVATALVAGFEIGGPRAEISSAAVQVAQRYPLASDMLTPVPITYFVAKKFITAQRAVAAEQAYRSVVFPSCATTPRGWPYASHECRVAGRAQTINESALQLSS